MFLPGLTGLDLDLCLALTAAIAAVFAAYMAASAGA